MKSGKQLLTAAMMVALGGLAGCTDGDDTAVNITVGGGGGTGGGTGAISTSCPAWTSARPVDEDGNDVCQLPTEILEDRTLTSDIVWFMASRVTVGNGNREMSATSGTLDNGAAVVDATLTIEAGTEIKAATGSFANLLITRGSKIDAEGDANNPIIFSSDDDGYDGNGEWGGVIIHGYGLHNECPADEVGVDGVDICNIDSEGESGFGGGYIENDNSGIFSYVIITEGGFEFAPGNEINGLSLIGVGSGTQIDHVQINDNADDGIEFYGGNVNVSHLVLTGNLDDSVDWDEGYRGNLQYVLVIQDPATTGNAIEADTEGSTDFDSKPVIANATYIGDGENDELLVFKKSSGGYLLNSIGTVDGGNATITKCFSVDGTGAEDNIGSGDLALSNFIAECDNFGTDAGDDPLGAVGLITPAGGVALDVNYASQAPEADGVALDLANFQVSYPNAPVVDTFLEETDYVGAVDPNAVTAWFEGWTLPGTL